MVQEKVAALLAGSAERGLRLDKCARPRSTLATTPRQYDAAPLHVTTVFAVWGLSCVCYADGAACRITSEQGCPAKRLRMLSDIARCLRRIVPSVHADMWGVMRTFESS